jgi:hypothetical protein
MVNDSMRKLDDYVTDVGLCERFLPPVIVGWRWMRSLALNHCLKPFQALNASSGPL